MNDKAKNSARRGHRLYPFLTYDPLPWLLSANAEAITTQVRRDLHGENVDVQHLWELSDPGRLLRRQQPDGSWRYPVQKPAPQNYDLYQTFLCLGELVCKYAFDKRHPAVQKAVQYVLSCQAPDGDFRGIYGNQTSHTYTPALLEVIVQAGYQDDVAVQRAYHWLLSTRQNDGGWAIAARTRDQKLVKEWDRIVSGPLLEADRTKPFSHVVTGMVLRALAAHSRYRDSPETLHGAALLKSRLFKADKYSDRKTAAYWFKFTYPFHFTDLLTAIDTLGRLGCSASDPAIARALGWFKERQHPDGSFALSPCRGTSDKRLPHWLGLALCRALLRYQRRERDE